MLATPSIRAIKQKYPDSELTVMAHPNRYQVLENLFFIDKLKKITKKYAAFQGYFSGAQYDFAFVYGFDKSLVSYAIRVSGKVISFTQKDQKINKKLYKEVPVPKFDSQHVVYQLAKLVESMDVYIDNRRLSYSVYSVEDEFANSWITKISKSDDIKIGLQVAGFPTKQNRNWPIKSFISLCQQLGNEFENIKFILFGSSDDEQIIGELTNAIGDKAYSLAGKFSLRESAAIMSKIDLYVGVDTGPTHIVGTFDIPVIALYRSTCPHTLTGALDHPCYYPIDHPKAYVCSKDMPMREITVDNVFATTVVAMQDSGVI